MKKGVICLFIDAFGWEILQQKPDFLRDLLPYRKPLESILGYSSACDPSIISGQMPDQHGHWSSYYWSPETTTYGWSRIFSLLPTWISEKSRARYYISKWIKWVEGYTGYFQIYQMPFKWLPFFDYAEKNRIWIPGGLNRGRSLFDELDSLGVPYYVGDQDSESVQFQQAQRRLQEGSVSFVYILLGRLDAAMHTYGTKDPQIKAILSDYEQKIRSLILSTEKHFDEVDFFLFSDHGMHDVKTTIDLQSKIEEIGLIFGKEYAAVYDSTMARFWFFDPAARLKIEALLSELEEGSILTDQQLKSYGVFFPDRKYGELIFLLKPGVLIVPSFMGRKKIPGMHGYEPKDRDSLALIMSNRPIPPEVERIDHIYHLLVPKTN